MAIPFSLINHSVFTSSSSPPPSPSALRISSLPIDSFSRRTRIRCGGTSEPYSDAYYELISTALNRLSDDRRDVLARMNRSFGSPEACLHRRIAEMKEEVFENAVEEITYKLIRKKFLEIGVPLEHKYLYKGRLDIAPLYIEELEAIHSPDLLEVIREHLTTVIGTKKAGSNVMISRATVEVETPHLTQVYSASILYGYFLKSASLKHRLERSFSMSYLDMIPSDRWGFLFNSGFYGVKSVSLGEFNTTPRGEVKSELQVPKLKEYLQGVEGGKMSKAAMDVVEKHCSILFIDEHKEPVLTSLDSLKRLVLEAIAFGCFLWESEEFIDRLFKLDK